VEEDQRPWGYYRVLAHEPDRKIKMIVVHPDRKLSLQRHRHRSEHWYIVQGKATVRKDESEIPVQAGSTLEIPQGSWHRISNTGETDTVILEVQKGKYLGEDDIERAEDDYGRI
jgi:mannose-6-phosphate isomerase